MSGPIVAIHQPQYLPWLQYFAKAAACDIFVYLDNVQYQRDGYQNRNMIKTHQGARWLTVPVHASLDTAIADVAIADRRWIDRHLKTLTQSYARAPFFPLLRDELAPILASGFSLLADLNIATTAWAMERLQIRCRQVRASTLPVGGVKDDLVIAICRRLCARVYLSGQGARAYQDEAKFAAAGIELRYLDFAHPTYPQMHPEVGFVPGLAAIDLIANTGPEARAVLLGAAA